MKKIFVFVILLLCMFTMSGCKKDFEVRTEGDYYIYTMHDIEIKSKVDVYKYIDKDNVFDYKKMALDLKYDKALCEEDNILCKTYTNNNIDNYKLEIYLTGTYSNASKNGHVAISDVGIRIKKKDEKTIVKYVRFESKNSKYLVNGSRDTLEIEQIVVLAYIMETVGNDPTSDVLSIFAGYEYEDQYLLPF